MCILLGNEKEVSTNTHGSDESQRHHAESKKPVSELPFIWHPWWRGRWDEWLAGS